MTFIEKIDGYIASPRGRKVIMVGGTALIALMIFHAGFVVGSRRHGPPHGRMWEFNGPGPLDMRVPHDFVRGGHGAVGEVTALTPTSITIMVPDGSTSTIALSEKTEIRGYSGATTSDALRVGAHVMILGNPGDEDLDADLIRILPPPPSR